MSDEHVSYMESTGMKVSEFLAQSIEAYIKHANVLYPEVKEEKKTYVKTPMYYVKLKNYLSIVNTPWDTIYIENEGELAKEVVLERLWLSKDLFDKADIWS